MRIIHFIAMHAMASVMGTFLFSNIVHAQVTTTVTNGTISVTNTFQNALGSQNGNRLGCTIQNQGTHTMYVFTGASASATTAKSLQLSPGQTFNCGILGTSGGGITVLQDAIQITGTSGDAYVLNAQ